MVEVMEGLIAELDARFIEQGAMDVMGIVYPQLWLQVDTDVTFT
jgi:hypothetical protein